MTKQLPPHDGARVDLSEVFAGIGRAMLADFDQIQAQIPHSGERGRDRERVVENFLGKYLPKKYALGTGHIMDRDGGMSRQCDTVVYDAFNCPLLLAKEGYQIFPVEAVLGVVEVKSTLNGETLAQSIENIRAAKALRREQPVYGVVFAYKTSYGHKYPLETLAKALVERNKNVPIHERIDLLCVLTEGIVEKGVEDTDEGVVTALRCESSPLVVFLYRLMEGLSERRTSLPNIVGYVTSGCLGIVRQIG